MTRYRGVKAVLVPLMRHILGKYCYLGLEKDVQTDDLREMCRLDYSLSLASDEDMEIIMQKSKTESKKSVVELIRRKRFYDSGFKRCYVAKTGITKDICAMQWLILPNDIGIKSRFYKKLFPRLGADEALLEMAYTFEKYRGNRLDPSIMLKLAAAAKSQGARRIIVYVLRDNTPSIRCCERAGFKKFETRCQHKFFFLSKISSKAFN